MKTFRNRVPGLFLFTLALCLPYLAGCAALQSAWSDPRRAATLKLLEADALAILEPAGVSLLQGLAAGQRLDGKALKTAARGALSVPAMSRVIADAGGSPALADNAAALAKKAMSKKGASEADAAAAALAAIQSALR